MERNINPNLTIIYIVRHGETEWNTKRLMMGHTDSPLTNDGEAQVRQIAKQLQQIQFAEIFSSDLLRAKRTAEVIALDRKIAVKTTQALRERHYGKFEGKPFAKYNQALRQLLLLYKNVTDDVYFKLKLADSETIEQSVTRFITFLREVAVGYTGKTVLVVTHGGVMRYFLLKVGFATRATLPPGTINNTAFIKVEADGVDFFIKETKGITKMSND